MRVLFVSSQFPNSSQSDLGIFSLNIVKGMMSSAEIKVIAPVPDLGPLRFINMIKKYKTDDSIPVEEVIDDIEVFHPKYFAAPKIGCIHHIALRTSLEPLIRQLHSKWKIDVINCHWLFPDGVAVQKIAANLRIPVMLTALGCDLNRYTKLVSRKSIIVQALLECDKLSVLNNEMVTKCLALGIPNNKIVVLPNGVDIDTFVIKDKYFMRSQLGYQINDKIILYVGSLVEVKNIQSLIKAFYLVSKDNSQIRLIIAGSGYLEKSLRKLSNKLGIQEKTSFLGKVDHNALPNLMNAADCLCLPSIREGHPNVMMEALACGIPVIASKLGSIPDFICSKNGLIIESQTDAKEIANKINNCLLTTYDRNTIRDSVINLSWTKCANKYIQELKCLC